MISAWPSPLNRRGSFHQLLSKGHAGEPKKLTVYVQVYEQVNVAWATSDYSLGQTVVMEDDASAVCAALL